MRLVALAAAAVLAASCGTAPTSEPVAANATARPPAASPSPSPSPTPEHEPDPEPTGDPDPEPTAEPEPAATADEPEPEPAATTDEPEPSADPERPWAAPHYAEPHPTYWCYVERRYDGCDGPKTGTRPWAAEDYDHLADHTDRHADAAEDDRGADYAATFRGAAGEMRELAAEIRNGNAPGWYHDPTSWDDEYGNEGGGPDGHSSPSPQPDNDEEAPPEREASPSPQPES